MTGRTFGVAGYGLDHGAGWAANAGVARAGAAGERKTAAVLDRLAADRSFTVMHDLRLPIPGLSANIDHVVVAGDWVLVIDSKTWRRGFFWTLGGRCYRGWERFVPAEKQTMVMAIDALSTYLALPRGHFPTPVVAVWPSTRGRLGLWALRMRGARVVDASRLEAVLASLPDRPADRRVEARLAGLLAAPSRW